MMTGLNFAVLASLKMETVVMADSTLRKIGQKIAGKLKQT